MESNVKIPLIKEYRVERLKKCLECIDKYAFDRDMQKECILSLYPNKQGKSIEHREKSIFRGMVIPSLRFLGLILGYSDSIKISANGKLIVESQALNNELHQRVLRTVIYELDKNIFHFIDVLDNSSFFPETIINRLCDRIDALSLKQKRERIDKWFSILRQVELINYSTQGITINKLTFNQVVRDVNVDFKNTENFKKYFLDVYNGIGQKTAGVVDITDLREKVSTKMLKEKNVIITEDQFDELLREIPFVTEKYIISLGKPMGAREKLLKYKNNYYNTIFIRSLRKR